MINEQGFSLVEVKVCCAIIAILTAVTYPYLAGTKDIRTLNREMRMLYSDVQQAKVEAIKENDNVAIKILADGYRVFIDDGCGGIRGDYIQQGCEKKLREHKYTQGVSMDRTTFSAQRFGFNGRVGTKAGSLILRNGSGQKSKLVVSTVGRIRIEKI